MPNLVRYVPSKQLFARIRVKGKLIRRSLKTKVLSVAKLRLAGSEGGVVRALPTPIVEVSLGSTVNVRPGAASGGGGSPESAEPNAPARSPASVWRWPTRLLGASWKSAAART